MKRLLLALAALLIALPAAAVDCSTDSFACRCMGVIYKDPELTAPGDLTIRVFNWERAGQRLNRRLLDQTLVVTLYSWASNGTHVCCNVVDNDGAAVSAKWDNITVTHVPAEAGELDQLLIGLYDASPEFGQWELIVDGGTSAMAEFPIAVTSTGQEATVLTGDSRGIPISRNQTLITRARSNRLTTLRNKMLDEGCG